MTTKIAFFIPSLRGGGAERVMITLLREFIKKGIKIDLIVVKAEGIYKSDIPKSDLVNLINLNASRVAFSFFSLVSYLRNNHPDTIISTISHTNIVAIFAKVLSRSKSRLVVRNANTLSQEQLCDIKFKFIAIRTLVKYTYPLADAIIANSKGSADDLAVSASLPIDKINIIFNPISIERVSNLANEKIGHQWLSHKEAPVIVSVGRLSKQKDFQNLINAFSIARKKLKLKLIILGEGPDRNKLEELIDMHNLQEDIQLPGFAENPYPYIKNSDLFVLSSLYEGLPNVLIEALSLGSNIVSTNCPSGPEEILCSGKWGSLVPVANPDLLAAAILEKINHNILNANAIDYSARTFGSDKIANQYLEILCP